MKMKVRCTLCRDSSNRFTVGKVYTWKDNTLVDDYGYCYDRLVEGTDIKQWGLSYWYDFEKVEENNNMSDKETWNMLKNKMEKNGILNTGYATVDPYSFKFYNPIYSEDMLIKAVGLAYAIGYKRAEKGRPFKYGDKVTD